MKIKRFGNMYENFDLKDHINGCCFVYIQDNEKDIEKYYDLVRMSKEDLIILYPERSRTFAQKVTYQPYVKSVVTEDPYIICAYDKKNVFIIRDSKWINPEYQTFGASVYGITDDILGLQSSINLRIKGGADKWLNDVKQNKQYR